MNQAREIETVQARKLEIDDTFLYGDSTATVLDLSEFPNVTGGTTLKVDIKSPDYDDDVVMMNAVDTVKRVIPRPLMATFEIKVAPKHAQKFLELLELPDRGNVALLCEWAIGQLLDSDNPSYTAGSIMRGGIADYGADVAEINSSVDATELD